MILKHKTPCVNQMRHTRYSIMNGKIRSPRSQGNSWNLTPSGTWFSFISTVFMTTGSIQKTQYAHT